MSLGFPRTRFCWMHTSITTWSATGNLTQIFNRLLLCRWSYCCSWVRRTSTLHVHCDQENPDGRCRTNSPSVQQKMDATEEPISRWKNRTMMSYWELSSQLDHKKQRCWNPQTDQLIFNISEIAWTAQSVELTKRNVVSVVGRFYNPLLFLAPIVLRFKLLFQKLYVNKMDWDQPLPTSLIDEWKSPMQELQTSQFQSQGAIFMVWKSIGPTCVTLCRFCASTKAYEGVVHLRVEADCGVKVQFVVSKTRVAPTQTLIIPKMLSALLLSLLMTVVVQTNSASLQP